MAKALATGTILKVEDENGDTIDFTVDNHIFKGTAHNVYSGAFVGADDESPSLLVMDLGNGFGQVATR